MSLARKVQRSFLLFLLLVLALAAVLVVSTPEAWRGRDAVTLAAVAALAALSWYRYRTLADSVMCDLGAAALVLVIGLGMPDHLTHVFGLSFVHLFVRTLDEDVARVVLNGILHPAVYFAIAAATGGAEVLVQMHTLTNLAGFAFVAWLMHTLAKSLAQQERLQREIAYHATHDPLTGLPNRALFTDRIVQALARSRRRDTPLAVVFVDLDNFKSVNDRHGHLVGDQLLTQWAQRLRGCMRGSDTAARLGGDEFALVLEDVQSLEQASAAVARIRDHLSEPLGIGDHTIAISASWGVALSTPASTPDQLLNDADTAMFDGKPAARGGPPSAARQPVG